MPKFLCFGTRNLSQDNQFVQFPIMRTENHQNHHTVELSITSTIIRGQLYVHIFKVSSSFTLFTQRAHWRNIMTLIFSVWETQQIVTNVCVFQNKLKWHLPSDQNHLEKNLFTIFFFNQGMQKRIKLNDLNRK